MQQLNIFPRIYDINAPNLLSLIPMYSDVSSDDSRQLTPVHYSCLFFKLTWSRFIPHPQTFIPFIFIFYCHTQLQLIHLQLLLLWHHICLAPQPPPSRHHICLAPQPRPSLYCQNIYSERWAGGELARRAGPFSCTFWKEERTSFELHRWHSFGLTTRHYITHTTSTRQSWAAAQLKTKTNVENIIV